MIQSDVRIIAATNIDIEEAVRNSRFRKDLYYRLNGVTIELPPLRDRTIDISILVVHFLERFRAEFGKDVRRVADDTMARLQTYSWPGNVRELQNVVRHALIRTQGPILRLEDLPLTIWRLSDDVQAPAGAAWAFDRFVDERLASAEDGLYHAAIRELERRLIIRVLNHTKGNQLQAAQRLGLARNTLRAKIREHGIVIKRAIER
jgi:two-component system nitrogen regulation response regulator GlnG